MKLSMYLMTTYELGLGFSDPLNNLNIKGVKNLRPYHHGDARSRLISEAKHGRAWLVLGWETAWEYQVL